ncbi:tyrosine-type recombinase/integrase [Dongia sp. agr-C8]
MPRSHQTINKTLVDREKPGELDRFIWDEDTPGFGLKITPAGRKVYVFQYRMQSGRAAPSRRYTIGKHGEPWTPSTARMRAEKLAQDVAKGIDPMAQKELQRKNTVAALIAGYADHLETKDKKSAELVRRALDRHVGKAWSKRAADTITHGEAQELVDTIGVNFPVQANRIATYLKAMFKWARRRGKVTNNPAEDLEKPGTEESRDRSPTLDELKEIWQAADPEGFPFGPFIKLLILTGQRRNEVAGMGWSEIDGSTWTIPKERAKNGLEHIVHLTPLALRVLAECPQIQGQDLVFSTTGETPISGFGKPKERIDKRIQEAREKAKRDVMPDWILHDFRRSLATGLNELGVAEHVADRILNHASRTKGGVKRIYNKFQYAEERADALRLWSKTLERKLSG